MYGLLSTWRVAVGQEKVAISHAHHLDAVVGPLVAVGSSENSVTLKFGPLPLHTYSDTR